jgi:hypothetical protein
MKVVKYSGEIVEFNPEKLKSSLSKSGASALVVDAILETIQKELHQGITTKQIYKMAFGLLKKASNSQAARYNLKEAIRLLGPAGFFFEKYIARLFESEAYKTKVNLHLKGNCVSHEVDILIKKENQIAMIECKFHMGKEINTDVKVPMYILSRFNDLNKNRHTIFSGNELISKCWIVTNTRFTSDAIDFGLCSGLNLLSWNYPENNCLKTKNDSNFLYPVTCLTSLSLAEKDKLLILDVILVKEILSNSDCLVKIGLSSNRIKNVLKEAAELCKYF